MSAIIALILFLAWGSFLNMLAYRLIHGNLSRSRSFCPSCKQTIAWYDNIPVISWIILQRRCRMCNKPISWLYPFIELITAIIFMALITKINPEYWIAYGLFLSGLIVTIRTDLETMLISRFASLYLVPFGLLFSYLNMLPISFMQSIIGFILGSGFLLLIGIAFKYGTKKDGIGQGDVEMLAFVGSFLGPLGVWLSICIGSVVGSVIGSIIMVANKKNRSFKIPFGPFLAIGAMTYLFFAEQLKNFLFY